MSISQRKYDLAVLLKMFEDAENDGGWVTRHDIKSMFSIAIPMRRIEAATEKLLDDGEIIRDYDPLNMEESRWQLTRSGIEVVERAMKVPNSFINRLSSNGDIWLKSDEAKKTVLNKKKRKTDLEGNGTYVFPVPPEADVSENVNNPQVVIQNINNNENSSTSSIAPEEKGVNWSSWITIIVSIITILVTIWLAGKFE